MNVERLRQLMQDLPGEMPVAVRGGGAGYDPLLIAVVRNLAPTSAHLDISDGVLTEEPADFQIRRVHFTLGRSHDASIELRLREAQIDGFFDPDDETWSVTGWRNEPYPWLAVTRTEELVGDACDD